MFFDSLCSGEELAMHGARSSKPKFGGLQLLLISQSYGKQTAFCRGRAKAPARAKENALTRKRTHSLELRGFMKFEYNCILGLKYLLPASTKIEIGGLESRYYHFQNSSAL